MSLSKYETKLGGTRRAHAVSNIHATSYNSPSLARAWSSLERRIGLHIQVILISTASPWTSVYHTEHLFTILKGKSYRDQKCIFSIEPRSSLKTAEHQFHRLSVFQDYKVGVYPFEFASISRSMIDFCLWYLFLLADIAGRQNRRKLHEVKGLGYKYDLTNT